MVNVLHILTLIGSNGEYGGPVTVARELRDQMSDSKNFKVSILAGTQKRQVSPNPTEQLIKVRKWLPTSSVSGLFSVKIALKTIQEIRKSDLVHLHFARDVIQIFAGVALLILRKPYITQTHGMVRPKNNLKVIIFDSFFTTLILQGAKYNLTLSLQESSDLKKIERKLLPIILENGIQFQSEISKKRTHDDFKIVFCARLHHTKGLNIFLELAELMQVNSSLKFEIYGPDGGELKTLIQFLEQKDNSDNIIYGGALSTIQVRDLFRNADLLIMPSRYDPYPMIVLEALSFGLPVLISPECGHSNYVSQINKRFVVSENSAKDFEIGLKYFLDNDFYRSRREEIKRLALPFFGVERIADSLQKIYNGSILK